MEQDNMRGTSDRKKRSCKGLRSGLPSCSGEIASRSTASPHPTSGRDSVEVKDHASTTRLLSELYEDDKAHDGWNDPVNECCVSLSQPTLPVLNQGSPLSRC
ncbi:hypothetical protein KC319_g53 [Hortaea werneckii]|nr:hypothetical protein KC319_g53 [Hortaea werneckii]